MAETQQPAGAGAEPSMEEILASIRKIISDDAPSDVVELTQAVQDDGSVMDITPPPPPPPLPEPPMPSPPPKAAPLPLPPDDILMSDTSTHTAASSLSVLANTVEIERLSTTAYTGTPLGNGARSLEDMVIELMRPMLKDWLDKNLPATVDRLVQKEIERIARRAQD